jgi:transposase
MATRLCKISQRGCAMDRRQAEALYDSGKEPTVEKLLELDRENKALQEKIASCSQDSTTSSKPPSSDGPTVQRPKKKPSHRNPGGQKGHKGKKRQLLPVEEMDHVYPLYPDRCERCARALKAGQAPEPSAPLRHQVFELPEIKPIKTEYQCHELLCSCGHKTRAPLPQQVAHSNFGPRVHAAIGYLTSVHRITRRGICEILLTLFGIDISLGAACDGVDRISQACEPPTEQIRQHIAKSQALNADETGWKSKASLKYLWVFVSSLAVFFYIAPSRGSKILKAVLGESFSGIITSDDHSAYHKYHKKGIRQLCWAHIIRKLKGLKEVRGSPDAYVFAKKMLKEIGNVFAYWHAFKQGYFAHEELWRATALIRGRIKKLCLHYQNSADNSVRTRARRLLKTWEHLFTFLRYEGVEPTNNRAEQALRPPVQWRKICFGSQSPDGERFTERILTITRTCQMQNRNAFHYLSELMTAYFAGQTLPSLLP